MKTAFWIIVVLGIAFFAAWSSGLMSQFSTSQITERTLVTLPAKPRTIRALGYIEPVSELRRLVFKVDGVIGECRAVVGNQVHKGEVLMTLMNQAELAAVSLAEQELAVVSAERDQLLAGTPPYQITAAEDKVELLREHVRHAQKQMDRSKTLSEKKAVSAEEVDRTETDLIRATKGLQQAQSELAHLQNVVRDVDQTVAETRVKKAEAQLITAKERLSDTFLKAPFDGTVLEILRREGEGPRLLDREPVVVFADMSRLRVRAEIDERYVASLKLNQKAVVFGRGLGDRKFEGTVGLIKTLMGPKTVFSRDASERKDLDIVQVLIELPVDFQAPIGLQVDVDVLIE